MPFFFSFRVLLTYPRLNVLSHTLTEYHHAFCFCKRYKISKSTHIYFIQIYIEFKYYISIWSFDTNQENPTIFNGKDVCIYSNGHIITSIIQPLPSHPCLLFDRWAAATKGHWYQSFIFILFKKMGGKQLLCIQGTEGVTRRKEWTFNPVVLELKSSHLTRFCFFFLIKLSGITFVRFSSISCSTVWELLI